jgi:hypothetical protein
VLRYEPRVPKPTARAESPPAPHMTERRFPAPWTVEEYRGISFIVCDGNKFAVAYASRVDERRPT